ncbi:MarR family winged helix-turn-helix transcriptional regulator [Staphylococcus simulans]|uniref:MarR family winged helix-turn-helix transcriptional regulator n=1 Tax=Staphylococcus simulans TaxID=1286 RepID=UPI0039996095
MTAYNNDYEHLLFYFAYKTFINTADELIETKGMRRQHHRFLFFIDKVPGITISDLLRGLEISKQGSHQTLKKLKDEGLVIERKSESDGRVKELFATDKGHALVTEINKAQNDLLHSIKMKVGNDWNAIMEELASKRPGFQEVQYLKGESDKE